jgi:hypothetical protein
MTGHKSGARAAVGSARGSPAGFDPLPTVTNGRYRENKLSTMLSSEYVPYTSIPYENHPPFPARDSDVRRIELFARRCDVANVLGQ